MSRRKEDSIGPCVWNCPDRSATCRATCERYAAHRQKSLAEYEARAKAINEYRAIGGVQFNGLAKYKHRRKNRK